MSQTDIHICYDFDGTLIAGNMQENSFFPAINMTKDAFWQEVKTLAKQKDMDEVLAYMFLMIDKARTGKISFNRSTLMEHGKNFEFFAGVETWFDEINAYCDDVTISHYIISSGLDAMITGCSISKHFQHIFASGFAYDEDDKPFFPARSINYTTKVQYLFRINKGIENSWDNSQINLPMKEQDRRSFSRMIYIGDGETDVPAMKMLNYKGGYSIVVYPPSIDDAALRKKTLAHELHQNDRCQYVAPADYQTGQPLHKIVTSIIDRIANERKFAMNLQAK